jgi:membrane peptidoglycan carboxypeptidase
MRSVTIPFAATRPRPRRWTRRVVVVLLSLLVLSGAGFALLLALTPSASDAEARTHHLAASRGVIDTGAAVPAAFASALVATEDSRFSFHHGVDTLGVLRAAGGLLGLSAGSGGATLDQQLAKMLYFGGQRNTTDQFQEVALSLKLDASYPKAEILQMYAQSAYYGSQAYGLSDAACRYFGKPAADLSWGQASLLAGLVQAPTAYDPYQHPDLAHLRQSHVLDRLVAMGTLTPAQAAAAGNSPWQLIGPDRPRPTRCGA